MGCPFPALQRRIATAADRKTHWVRSAMMKIPTQPGCGASSSGNEGSRNTTIAIDAVRTVPTTVTHGIGRSSVVVNR
jgi:hypothetical protein